jgi:hypothetical protein
MPSRPKAASSRDSAVTAGKVADKAMAAIGRDNPIQR